jgi:hypothetical protein
MNRRRVLLMVGVAAGAMAAGFGLRSVLAVGIPDTNPLYYAGTLTESGQPVTGMRDITVNIWSAATGGTMLCQTAAAATTAAQVVNGRFRIALAAACKTALNQNNDTWVEVIDGITSLGRAPIGAVPYAVEADHAASATTVSALAAGPVAGGLMVFNPSGAVAPCAVSGGTGSVVDCTCPSGTFVVSGGGDAGQTTGHFIRESRATTTTTWRVTCANGTADALCQTYNLVCSRIGP